METKLTTWFLNQGWCCGVGLSCRNVNVQGRLSSSHLLLPASCKMRNRNYRRQNTRKLYPNRLPDGTMQGNIDEDSPDSCRRTIDLKDNCIDITVEAVQSNEENNSTRLIEDISASNVSVAKEQISAVDLCRLLQLIKNAEKNVLLLNQARAQALVDLNDILSEKESLQGQIKILEMKLSETDALLRVSAQDKINAEFLADQLEKLQSESSNREGIEENVSHLNSMVHSSDASVIHSLSEEIESLKLENMSLRSDLQLLKEELSQIEGTGIRVQLPEKEKSFLESSIQGLEEKLASSQEAVSQLPTLKYECKTLYDKVENLQELLDRATIQANQAIFVLQENQELRKKVDKLEESLEEAKIYKLSSEKMQQYNGLMLQKIKILDERLERSDAEINEYVQSYEDSVKEFQDTLNHLKEESKIRSFKETVNDMPIELWSGILLKIDGWLLEKKISSEDGKLLREMVRSRDGRIFNAYISCKEKDENERIDTLLQLISSSRCPGLHVVHIAAEMAPVAKVGGLGDVVTGLSKALQKRGHLVEVVIPKYDCMQHELIIDLKELDVDVESYFDGQLYKNRIWTGIVEGLPVYFIEPHHPGGFFWRGQYYGEGDDLKRFSYFSRAALELLLHTGKRPDVIHCHDWQTAFVAPLYWDLYVHKGLNSARICFTCHNFEYQGTAPASEIGSCGLDVHQLNRPDRMQDNSAHDRVNPVKGAIVFSNIVTTVSPTYAQEVQTAEGGRGLHATLNTHAKKFVGILNGIDTDIWNPATDNLLEVHYSAFDIEGKAENKKALQRHLSLSYADARQPLVGCVTRLVPQKGVHLIRHAIFRTLELGGQFVLLGSSPVPHIQREFEDISNHFRHHEHCRLILKYDESLAHKIFAASDMFIIPSIFEPCGLTQMIAMRYGSIPIARKTGGLNDSVFDVDDDSIPEQFRNGFTFLTADEKISSCVDTPQQNGVAERKNRQLLEMARALMFSMNVPKYLWGEAILTAAYLINRLPSKIHNFDTPRYMTKGLCPLLTRSTAEGPRLQPGQTPPLHLQGGVFTWIQSLPHLTMQGMNDALERAIVSFGEEGGKRWNKLVEKVMRIDFSWDTSASMYEQLYHKAVARARAAASANRPTP